MTPRTNLDEAEIFAIEHPAPQLLTAYCIFSLVLGPFFFIPLIPLYFRYHTLRYRFDTEGIHKRWGIFFRREINLTYARIQDIHLRSNPIERWLGLARIEVQTASGGAGAEMTLVGLLEFEAIRDYLYARMRGVHSPTAAGSVTASSAAATTSAGAAAASGAATDSAATDELAATLHEVAAELRALRRSLDGRSLAASPRGPHGG